MCSFENGPDWHLPTKASPASEPLTHVSLKLMIVVATSDSALYATLKLTKSPDR